MSRYIFIRYYCKVGLDIVGALLATFIFNTNNFPQAQTARNSSWFTIFEKSAPDAQSIVVTGLVPFTKYRLRIVASNVVGSSTPSEPCAEFQTIQAPPQHAPRNVTVRAVSATDLRVRWIVSRLQI